MEQDICLDTTEGLHMCQCLCTHQSSIFLILNNIMFSTKISRFCFLNDQIMLVADCVQLTLQ